MKRLLIAAALPLALVVSPARADPPAGFEARVESVREAAGTPGLAIAIVENGKVVLARGYGVRKLGDRTPVDADTIFMIGSTGKAFTSAALATLVDAGRIGWDDKVIDHLPGFQMYDPWVTREITIRDLLVHRSGLGLGAGDLLSVPRGSLSRAETVRRLRYIKPATSFRSGYAYDNILYAVAGQLIEAVSGQRWEDYVRDHVLRPAGMRNSTSDNDDRFKTPNRAFPHGRTGGAVRGLGEQRMLDERDELGRALAPAGLLASSANDMAKWLQIQLAHGTLPGGGRLFSGAASAEMWKPVTVQPIRNPPPLLAATKPNFLAYALGWEVRDYRGARIVWHSGGVFGFTTIVALIPEKNTAFAIMLNSEDAPPRFGLMYELLDHYLGAPRTDWPAHYGQYVRERLDAAKAAVEAKLAAPAKAGPSLVLDRYAGTYSDPWYGNVVIGKDANGLTIDFTTTPDMRGRLVHYQYDTFVAELTDRNIERPYVTFSLGAEGDVERVTMKPVSPTADFSFNYQDLLFTPVKAKR
jgi:CubicO group peptidase (beta-lactamase class C family)